MALGAGPPERAADAEGPDRAVGAGARERAAPPPAPFVEVVRALPEVVRALPEVVRALPEVVRALPEVVRPVAPRVVARPAGAAARRDAGVRDPREDAGRD